MKTLKALGFYTYQRFTVDEPPSENESSRDDDAAIHKEVLFQHNESEWKLLVSRDGLVQYHCSRLQEKSEQLEGTWDDHSLPPDTGFEPIWSIYLKHLNLIHFLLECSLHLNVNICAIEFFELKYLDTIRVTYEDSKPTRHVFYGGSSLDGMIRRGLLKSSTRDPHSSFKLPITVLNDLCVYYLTKLIIDETKISFLLPIAKALNQHNLRNYDAAVVLCWFVAEQYINDIWNNELTKRSIMGHRKKILQGNNYNASIKTEILELLGIINTDFYTKCNKIRKIRNNVAHDFGNKNATKQNSIDSLNLAREIAETKLELKFPFNALGTSVVGV